MDSSSRSNNKKRRLIPLAVILTVIALCAVIVFTDDEPLLSMTERYTPVSAVSDGSGGAIVAWQEESALYLQRIDPSGNLLWSSDLRIINSVTTDRINFSMIPDGSGGVVVSWEDDPEKPENERIYSGYSTPVSLYCRKINAEGQLVWSSDPVAEGTRLVVTSDGSGGAVLAWDAFQPFSGFMRDNFLTVQRISANGEKLWGDEGKLIVASTPYHYTTDEEAAAGIQANITRTLPSYEGSHRIIDDTKGSMYISWSEKTSASDHTIHFQLLDSNGSFVWPETIAVAGASGATTTGDVTGGVIITTYKSNVTVGEAKLYDSTVITHIDREGKVTESEEEEYTDMEIIPDGTGGSFRINRPQNYNDVSLIARFNAAGEILWNDIRAIPDDGEKHLGSHFEPDGSGGIITVWDDYLQDTVRRNIRARKIDETGTIVWAREGVPVFDVPGTDYQRCTAAVGDGNGGIIIFGILGKTALPGNMIYARHLDTGGNPTWESGIRINP